jgi:hypothetical protein
LRIEEALEDENKENMRRRRNSMDVKGSTRGCCGLWIIGLIERVDVSRGNEQVNSE